MSNGYTITQNLENGVLITQDVVASTTITGDITTGGIGPVGPAGPTGATGLTGPQGATGTVNGFFDVTAYGAIGDGTTDDTIAIQNAIDAAHANTGGIVFFPAGTYKISSQLTLASYITLQGVAGENGVNGSVINQTSTTANGIGYTANPTTIQGVVIERLTIHGPGATSGKGIYLKNLSIQAYAYMSFRDVTIVNFGGDYGFQAECLIVSVLENVKVVNCGAGFYLYGAANGVPWSTVCTSVSFIGCYANTNPTGTGFNIDHSTYITLTGCASDDNATGYLINNSNAVTLTGCGNEYHSPSTASPGNAYKISGGSKQVGLYTCYSYQPKNISLWITGNSTGNTVMGFQENTPVGTTAYSIQVDAGSNMTISDSWLTTATNYAANTVTILNDSSGNATFPGTMGIGGTVTMSGSLRYPNYGTLKNTSGTSILGLGAAGTANYLAVEAEATGNAPTLYAQGSDTNIGMFYLPKGTGKHEFGGTGGIQVDGGNGYLLMTASTDGAQYNLSSNASGNLALFGQASATLNLELIDGYIQLDSLTATTVPYLDGNKRFVSSSVTPTQLGYLSGATGTTGTGSLAFGTNPTMTIDSASGSLTIKGQTGFTLQDATDPTKQAQFIMSTIATGTTRTYTLPNSSSTLAILGANTFTSAQTLRLSDAATTTVTQLYEFGHNSSGTPAAGYGARLLMTLKNSTTANTNAASLDWLWTTATAGSTVSNLLINLVNGGSTLAEVGRFTPTGLTLGVGGTLLGRLTLSGNTSGTTILQPAATASGTLTLPAATDTLVGQATTDTLTNKTLTTPKLSSTILDSNGNALIGQLATASAVNYLTVQNGAAAGTGVWLYPSGSDTNVDLTLSGKGTGAVKLFSGNAVVGTADTQTLTNKSMSGDSNTFTNIGVAAVKAVAWTSYTPTVATGSVGNGTVSGAYQQIGKTVHFVINFTLGSTSSAPSGTTFTLPTAAETTLMTTAKVTFFTGGFWDSSASVTFLAFPRLESSTTVRPLYLGGATGTTTGTPPATPATSDIITINGTYQAA